MAGTATTRSGRRRTRRPPRRAGKLGLIALGLVFAVGASYAVAASTGIVNRADEGQAPVASAASRAPRLSLRATPGLTVTAGETARYVIHIKRKKHSRGRVRMRVKSGLPPASTASFRSFKRRIAQRPVTVLTLRTDATTPSGTYRLIIGARWRHRRARTSVSLIVRHPASPIETAPGAFRIGGNLVTPLSPGTGEPLDLSLANAGTADLSISRLTVDITAVSAPRADADHPCSAADFSVRQFSGAYGFVLRASDSTSLSALGVPSSDWPVVTMLDTALNQDGCQDATLSFAFAGTAIGGGP